MEQHLPCFYCFPENNIRSLIPIILIGGTQQGKKNMRKLGRRATREQVSSSSASAWLSLTLLPTWKPSGQKRPTWTSSKRLRWVKVSFSIVSNSLFFWQKLLVGLKADLKNDDKIKEDLAKRNEVKYHSQWIIPFLSRSL